MKKIFSIITGTLLLIITSYSTFAQGSVSVDPFKSIQLNPRLQDDTEIPTASQHTLAMKLRQMSDGKGIGGDLKNPRFVITVVTNILSEEVTTTAPPMIVLNLEMNFFIGDGIKGKVFAIMTKNVKGVGTNKTKAYNSAINSIATTDSITRNFVRTGKLKIVEYYETKCDEVTREADLLVAANEYDKAIYYLSLVPKECSTCFDKSLKILRKIVPERAAFNCQSLLLKAQAQWAASLNEDGADSVAHTLSQIGINATPECKKEINKLIAEMSKTIRERNNIEWKFKEELYKEKMNDVELVKKLSREMAVEYAKKQQVDASHYNINNWKN